MMEGFSVGGADAFRALREACGPDVRARGERLHRRGAVELLCGGAGPPWRAVVAGSERYAVEIDPDGDLLGGCECRAFESFGPCKHMWATVLALRDRGGRGGAQHGQRQLERLRRLREPRPALAPVHVLHERTGQVHYVLLGGMTREHGAPALQIVLRRRLVSGRWSVPKPLASRRDPHVAEADRALLDGLGARRDTDPWSSVGIELVELDGADADALIVAIARTGRLFFTPRRSAEGAPDDWLTRVAADEPAEVVASGTIAAGQGHAALHARLELDGRPLRIDDIRCVVGDHLLLAGDRLLRWRPRPGDNPDVLRALLRDGPIEVPHAHAAQLEAVLARAAASPPPAGVPVAQVCLHKAISDQRGTAVVPGSFRFRYGATIVDAADPDAAVRIGGQPRLRDLPAERALLARFAQLGGVLHEDLDGPRTSLPGKQLVACVCALLAAGFEVFAARARLRAASAPRAWVSSGIDWLAVRVEIPFDDQSLTLARLLDATRRKQQLVQLGDGSLGVLAPRDVARLAQLAAIGTLEGDALRLANPQAALLDALFEGDEVSVDDGFARLRARLALRPVPAIAPAGLRAELRPYQREGLGWLRFLGEIGCCGCLADDMGLGKTVQVLALLEGRRNAQPHPGPSLVVAPRTLLGHWQREAARFAPGLRVLSFADGDRSTAHAEPLAQGFPGCDLVLTTYGCLRRDAAALHDVQWDYVVLDEASAIKNERSQAHKAARLCRARHRLALSGTPIENHIAELWALFQFLNPGMLGRSSVLEALIARSREEDSAELARTIGAAVRPFLLRRTKAAVLDDLPPKTEQVLECELPPAQRRAYDTLAEHYRREFAALLDEGLSDEARIRLLTALLRLRQAACHLGLLDKAQSSAGCGKFEVLWPMLAELRAQGHKALVFSQFPSFLRLLQPRLREAGFAHAWLDGATTDRQAQVDRFQNDPDCGLFLLSLKAGGYGLNLTAASYVFVLDPWWNPAAQAQAIDRAHRIGQRQSVHAYRLTHL
jgi:hypothetical protein